MHTYLPDSMLADMALLWNALGNQVVDVSLFGSAVNKGFEAASDIDIAVTIRGMPLARAKNLIEEVCLTLPVRICQANGSYVAAPPTEAECKDYHIILLDANHPNKRFLEINGGQLKSLIKGTHGLDSESYFR